MLTIIIPMRNEERFVSVCLDSVLSQLKDFPECEVLCVNGASTDRTSEIVLEYAKKDFRVRLIENPQKIVPTGMNKAIRQSSGDIIIRLDCHAEYDTDYIKNCVEVLKRTGADNVGGYIDTVPANNSSISRAIAAAISSKFGVGGSTFRTGGGEKEVDTVPFGCFRRDVFDRFGFYNESLVRNQDIELNSRIIKGGGKIIISPSIRLKYFMRTTFSGLREQSYNNGLWNPYTVYLTGGGLKLRHFVPLGFVLSLTTLLVGSLVCKPLSIPLGAETLLYIGACGAVSTKLAKKADTSAFLVMLSIMQLHLSYGLGSLCGFLSAPFKFGLPDYAYRIAKRAFDIAASVTGLIAIAPIMMVALLAVWASDRHNPFYAATRTGKNGKPFKMLKIRSMVAGADKANVWATSVDDQRITGIGKIIRACKLDELPQLWNVLKGDMSFVGPRPLAPDETAVYTSVERELLTVQPGITDIASIVFADEGDILAGSNDPSYDYDRLIRPWKSRLGLFYIGNRSFGLDMKLIVATIITVIDRKFTLGIVQRLLRSLGADLMLLNVASRESKIPSVSPPGLADIAFSDVSEVKIAS